MKKAHYVSIILFLFILVLAACTNNKDKDEKITYEKNYTYQVTDTLVLKHIGTLIKPLDFNRTSKNILFGNTGLLDTIVQTDSQGNIINKLYFLGGGETEAGSFIHNIGYYNDSTILVNSERGFFFYDLNGKYIRSIKETTPLKAIGGGISKRIREMNYKGQNFVILPLKSSLTDFESSNFFSKPSQDKYKFLTFYNLDDTTYDVKFGYEANSLFKTEDSHFGDPTGLFDYNDEQRTVYVIHNPDPKIYKYNAKDNFNTPKVIDLNPEYFKLPIKYRMGEKWEAIKHLILNSEIKDINYSNDFILVTYRTGLPEDIYNSMESNSELPRLFKEYMKYYSILLSNDQKVSNDIPLPYGATGVGLFSSIDHIILNTNPSITEVPNGTVYYICKLIVTE